MRQQSNVMIPSALSDERHDRRLVAAAAATSFLLGVAFIWLWSPLPFGWEGFDNYYRRALALAGGEGFNTANVPWAYTFFLAGFYRAFGDHPWIPLLVQVLLNVTIPLMMYRLVSILLDRRTAVVAAVLIGVFSFNTIYASTQSSDAVCNVLFVAAVLVFVLGWPDTRRTHACAAGVLLGLTPQFRPNLLLFPALLAFFAAVYPPRTWRRARYAAIMLAVAVVMNVPWTVRNYRLMGKLIPASTHGPATLWYGTLEVFPYATRAYHPRSIFEETPFAYSSIPDTPIPVSGRLLDCGSLGIQPVSVLFWTDRDPVARQLPATVVGDQASWQIPAQPDPTAVYYRFVSPASGTRVEPALENNAPYVYFVSTDHLGDPDRHGDLLDVFDIARLLLRVEWNDPVPFAAQLDVDGDGRLTEPDLRAAVKALVWPESERWTGVWVPPSDDVIRGVVRRGDAGVIQMRDGSELVVPRGFTRLTDLSITPPSGSALPASASLARTLFFRTRPMASLRAGAAPAAIAQCPAVARASFNAVFYRREVHDMQRFSALALDNIRREPLAFAIASLYRALRVFIVVGSPDRMTAMQFNGSSLTYLAGFAASVTVFLFYVAGVVVSVARRKVPWPLLLPTIYVPLTIAPLFANMRYSITVQPFQFAFVALTLLMMYDALRDRRRT